MKYHTVSVIRAYCSILAKKSKEYSHSHANPQKPTLLFSEPALYNSKSKQKHLTEWSHVCNQEVSSH